MIENDKKIRKGLPPRRDAACFQVQRDIVIPAGTILRQTKPDTFAAKIGNAGEFSLFVEPGDTVPEEFKRVIA